METESILFYCLYLSVISQRLQIIYILRHQTACLFIKQEASIFS